ncbi:hypothetical protein K2X05_02230, partial [bacterium]|nr:hypothetical protein [bacterium]
DNLSPMLHSTEQQLTLGVKKSLNRERLSKTGNAVYNDDIRQYLSKNIATWFSDHEQFNSMTNMDRFVVEMKKWILSSQHSVVLGLDDFEVGCVSLGVTQALDQFHYDVLREGRRLRLLRGEYPYNRDVYPFSFEKDFVDDFPLVQGDALILSSPFSATGNLPLHMGEILDSCQRLEIPVFIDLAWFGTCGGLTFDLRHPAITHVAFSLTKGLTCGNYRSGVRWTRKKELLSKGDRLLLQHEWNHSIHLNLKIGRELMSQYSPDTQFDKYRRFQLAICSHYGIEPSACVHIATSHDPKWKDFDRDGIVNRINLRDAIKLMYRAQAE